MNWLTNLVRPRIRSLVGKTEVPDNLWRKCTNCEQMLFYRELEEKFQVCPHCNYHFRLNSKDRFKLLFDKGVYKKISLPIVQKDPLKFKDHKKYVDRLKAAYSATGETDAVSIAEGNIGQTQCIIAAIDFEFMGGSMGLAFGEAIIKAANLAVKKMCPLIVIPSSGGARMQEGIISLMQMPRTVAAINHLRKAKLPYIVILTDPTTGGVLASFAILGDVHIAEPGAIIGFAGPRVIEETIKEKLPTGFQRSEYLMDHGMIDMVVERHKLKQTLEKILKILTKQ